MITLLPLERPLLTAMIADPAKALAGYSGVNGVTELLADVAQATLALYSATDAVAPWISYLGIREYDRAIRGTCGFKGPARDGAVEIAYFTFPAHEGKGVAKTMAAELVRIAFSDPAINQVIAETLPQENASTTILRGLRFKRAGEGQDHEVGLVWRWALTAPRSI